MPEADNRHLPSVGMRAEQKALAIDVVTPCLVAGLLLSLLRFPPPQNLCRVSFLYGGCSSVG
jgi:hypothetical protein